MPSFHDIRGLDMIETEISVSQNLEQTRLEGMVKDLELENEELKAEADRTSELESIAWIDFYGEKEVIDDIKAYRFRDDILAMKKENKELKKENENWANIMMTATSKLQRKKDDLEEYIVKRDDENHKLKKQNERLIKGFKQRKEELKIVHRNWEVQVQDGQEEYDEMREENAKEIEKLKTQNSRVIKNMKQIKYILTDQPACHKSQIN